MRLVILLAVAPCLLFQRSRGGTTSEWLTLRLPCWR